MFNVHLYDQKLHALRAAERDHVQQLLVRQKQVSDREVLTANYARRVDQFIINMANDPIQLAEHISPMAVVPRDSNPMKYKGPARMILKSTASKSLNASRLNESVKNIQIYDKSHARKTSKELKSREFLKRGAGVQRLQAISQAKLPMMKKKTVEDKNAAAMDSLDSSRESIPMVDERPKMKPMFRDLHRKTHFKGVMSRLVETSFMPRVKEVEETDEHANAFHRSRTASILWRHSKVLKRVFLKESESSMLAKEILESCKVIPHVMTNTFLRRGEGRLTSNPHVQLSEVYKHLQDSFSEQDSQA